MLLITAQGNVEDAIREGFLAVDEDMLKGRQAYYSLFCNKEDLVRDFYSSLQCCNASWEN